MARSINIQNVSTRSRLEPRREPYWERIGQGCYLGYRTMTAGKPGSWIARHYDEATGTKPTKALGDFSEHPDSQRFDAAKGAALTWFEHLGRGGASKTYTVTDACDSYIQHTKTENGDNAARDAESRLKRLVLSDKKLASVDLEKLTPGHVNTWRKSLLSVVETVDASTGELKKKAKAKATVNRDMSALRAVLNHAHKAGWVTSDHAWKNALLPFKDAGTRRETYLSNAERKSLADNCPDDLAALVRCLSLLPLRPGAAAALTVRDLDTRQGTLTIRVDKASAGRKIGLPPPLVEFFKTHSASKLPAAPIFTRSDGRPWDKDMWKYPLKEAAAAANLPAGTVLYSLRHSTITDLIAGGLDPLTVSRLSGTSIAMIQKHYGHLTEERARDALTLLAG